MIESWDELIDTFGRRPGMWVGRGKYSLVRSFVAGFGAARADDVLEGFQAWMAGQPQHRSYRNFAWWPLILREAFPDGGSNWKPPARPDPKPGDWSPRPVLAIISEDELTDAEDRVAVDLLMSRLRQFLDLRSGERSQ